jgi:aspartate carbamoyltransferase catalytic subunit
MAKNVKAAVINGGDGMHAHPSQALLDMMSVREKAGTIAGKRIAIIGDIAHSRVARSNAVGFSKMGASVVLAGPPTMLPIGIETYGVDITSNIDEAVTDADIIMMLRIQKERQENFLFSTAREYAREFGLSAARVKKAKKDVIIMHPGPMNRGVEISEEVADGPYSIILEQVTNGVALRMALFYLLAGGSRDGDDN